MPSDFIKQPTQLNNNDGIYLNSGGGDSVVGGRLSSVPTDVIASQGIQTIPGDRLLLGEADAQALDDPDVGTLYGGMYQYIRTKTTSTAAFARAHGVFWDTGVAATQYQVTADENGLQGVGLFAGVTINTITKGYSWWIQTAGRISVQFRAVLTGLGVDGSPVFLAAAGAGADVGEFDVLEGGANPSFTQMVNAVRDYVGVAQGAPVNDTISTINIPLGRIFRW